MQPPGLPSRMLKKSCGINGELYLLVQRKVTSLDDYRDWGHRACLAQSTCLLALCESAEALGSGIGPAPDYPELRSLLLNFKLSANRGPLAAGCRPTFVKAVHWCPDFHHGAMSGNLKPSNRPDRGYHHRYSNWFDKVSPSSINDLTPSCRQHFCE